MKAISVLLAGSALATLSSVGASWTSPLNLFERDVQAKRSTGTGTGNPRLRSRASPSPSPPKPAEYSLSLPDGAKYLACPAAGFQEQIVPTIFYYPDGRVVTRCTSLVAGGGSSYCDYNGLTGNLKDRSYKLGDQEDYCKDTKAIAKTGNYECYTTCAGPSPFTYAVIDVYEHRQLCFFNGYNTAGDALEVGCSYNPVTGAELTEDNKGTICTGVSSEMGKCAATLA